MGRDYFGEYATIEARIAELEAQKEALKPQIIEEMVKKGTTSEPFPFGTFSLSKYKTWSYPDSILEKESEVKALKAKAQSTGDAEFTEKDSLRYTVAKL